MGHVLRAYSTALSRCPARWQAVVFDMDGLLVHTERQWLQAKLELFRRYDRQLTDADKAAVFGAADLRVGDLLRRASSACRPSGSPALQTEYLDIVGELIDEGVEITDGAGRARRATCAARFPSRWPPTRDARWWTASWRRRRSPAAFEAITTGDEVPPKPAPDVYLLACERIGVEPATAVAVEDSPTGVRAAQAAGLTCIGVPSDADHPLAEADYQVASLTELL